MSLTEISVRVAIVTALALVALIAIGWRRGAPRYPRRAHRSGPPLGSVSDRRPDADGIDASADGAPVADHVGKATTRKLLDLLGLGSIAAFVGIVVALVTSIVIASLVTALLNRL